VLTSPVLCACRCLWRMSGPQKTRCSSIIGTLTSFAIGTGESQEHLQQVSKILIVATYMYHEGPPMMEGTSIPLPYKITGRRTRCSAHVVCVHCRILPNPILWKRPCTWPLLGCCWVSTLLVVLAIDADTWVSCVDYMADQISCLSIRNSLHGTILQQTQLVCR
jgi:hypothetical protein